MLQLFAAYVYLTSAIASLEETAFAMPPAFGTYDLRKQTHNPQPLINLEETCVSSNLQDVTQVIYQVDGLPAETLSCSEAFEMHRRMYSEDVCDFAYHINDDEHTLLEECGKTFCSQCSQVEIDDEDVIVGKEAYEINYIPAPGFEMSYKVKQTENIIQGMAAPMPMNSIDDASLPSLNDDDEIAMLAPLPAQTVVVGIEAPSLDTSLEESLEAPMMKLKTSMVPPGLESASGSLRASLGQIKIRTPKRRLSRFD